MAEPITVWMHPALIQNFKDWLTSRDLHLYGPMTFEPDEQPQQVYMVGIGAHPAESRAFKDQPGTRNGGIDA